MQTMKEFSVSQDIVPIGEFKAHASQLLKRLAGGARPLVITQNGRPAAVVLSPAEYDRMRERDRFLASVAAGIDDAEARRVMDSDALRARLAEHRRAAGRA
jgi:prevent-host-death family protein